MEQQTVQEIFGRHLDTLEQIWFNEIITMYKDKKTNAEIVEHFKKQGIEQIGNLSLVDSAISKIAIACGLRKQTPRVYKKENDDSKECEEIFAAIAESKLLPPKHLSLLFKKLGL